MDEKQVARLFASTGGKAHAKKLSAKRRSRARVLFGRSAIRRLMVEVGPELGRRTNGWPWRWRRAGRVGGGGELMVER
jgi:hypothetical protein